MCAMFSGLLARVATAATAVAAFRVVKWRQPASPGADQHGKGMGAPLNELVRC